MSRGLRLIRACLAGAVVGCGIGLGAHNPWWAALAFGVPLVVVGFMLAPRATRLNELPVFRRGGNEARVPISVSALTRSSADSTDLQPTLITASITPPADTAYEARWVTAMDRGHFTSIVDDPTTSIPESMLPARTTSDPQFDRSLRRWSLIYPTTVIAVALALTFGVSAETWRFDAMSLVPSFGSSDADNDAEGVESRFTATMDKIRSLGTEAADHVLQIRIDHTGSDRAEVYDPQTGEAISVWRSSAGSKWQEPTRSSTPLRTGDSFPLSDIASADVGDIVDRMRRETAKVDASTEMDFVDLTTKRPSRGAQVVLTGGFGDGPIADAEIQARPDGTVAEYFQPGDFPSSFRLMRVAMGQAELSTTENNLRRFEIRGIADNTPTMYAGSIQNSGGVLVEFQTPGRSGTIAVVPGSFPEISSYATGSRGDFSFDDVSPDVFEKVRDDAMRRGNVDAFDRNAIDIQMWSVFRADNAPVIMVEIARESASAGTYSPSGEFLEAGVR